MNTANFINLTPHAITVRVGGVEYIIPASGLLARVQTDEADAPHVYSVPCVARKLGAVTVPDLPTVEPGDGAEPFQPHWLIVASMVLDAAIASSHPLVGRMLAPDTGPTAIREAGQVRAVTRFVRA